MNGALYENDETPDIGMGLPQAMPDMPIGIPGGIPQGPPPGMPPQQAQGMFPRMQQFAQDNSGLLLAAASGIGKGTPMGDMASAIQDHYTIQDKLQQKKDASAAMLKMQKARLDEQSRMNSSKIDVNTAKALKDGTAQVKVVGNGVYSVTAPGGTPQIMTSEDYQNFAMKKVDRQGQWEVLASGAKQDGAPPTAAQAEAQKSARDAVEASNETLGKYRAVKELLEQNGAPGMSALPILSQLNQAFGTDDAQSMQRLNSLKIDAAFKGIPRGQGAMSNLEREILLSDLPKDYADTKSWLAYVNRKIGILEKADKYNQSELEKANNIQHNGLTNAESVIQRMSPATQVPPQVPAQAPAQVPTPAPRLQQQYPPGFNPPNNGRAPQSETLGILTQEYQDELKKPDSSPGKQANLASLQREIQRAGGQPLAAPAVKAPAAAAGVPTFNSVADLQAAVKAGKLKSGDVFMDPQGNKRKVH